MASPFHGAVKVDDFQLVPLLKALRMPRVSLLLADDVGLGKTIEAGLVISQRWAERRRRLLVICPASLRKQWAQELHDKFAVPTTVVDAGCSGWRNFEDFKDKIVDRAKTRILVMLNIVGKPLPQETLATCPLSEHLSKRLFLGGKGHAQGQPGAISTHRQSAGTQPFHYVPA